MLRRICREVRRCNPEVLEIVIEIAIEIARQRVERSSIGTLFVVGDEEGVLKRSKPLILDPLAQYPREVKDIRDANVQGTIKELARLDGAFLISGDGYVLSAARYIEASSRGIDLPMGFGSRHMAAASISKETDAVAVVVSAIKPRIKGECEKIGAKDLNLTLIVKST
ncbi:MAG: diadenylate cyclase [archaeon]|nr:diadenylate cyclase [archaeon]